MTTVKWHANKWKRKRTRLLELVVSMLQRFPEKQINKNKNR